MLVFQPSLRRITVVECGPLLTCRRAGPTRVVRRRGGRRALTSGPVDAASNRGISGSPISSEHPLETARRVSSHDVLSGDGGRDLVAVGYRMSGWFASNAVTGMKVQVTPCSNGPYWFGSASSATLRLKPARASHCVSPVYLRYLLIAEVTEIFMSRQNAGRFQDNDEASKSECLSQFLSAASWTSTGPSICHFAPTMARPQPRTDRG